MRQDEQIRVIEGLMKHLDDDTNVDAGCQVRNPVSSYLCPDLAQREWDEFFQNYPHVLGLSGDLPGPRTFLTSNELGKPILCTRDKDGVFRAFLNVCRHRGTVVETEERGEKNAFQCPFHAWTYNHAGSLIGVPKEGHFGQVDRECNSLVELPAVERHGILWVSPDPKGEFDIDAQLGDLGPELASWNLEKNEPTSQTTYPHAMNWKLAIDTFGETYHFNSLHRDTLINDFYGNVQMYDTYERNHRMTLCLRSIDDLRGKPKDEWNVLRASLPAYYLFPNVQLLMGAAGPTLVRIYPQGADPHQSFSRIDFYLDPAAPEGLAQEFGIEGNITELLKLRSESFAQVIRDEDYVAAASSHRGMRSGAFDHVTFGRNEPALHHYHNTYRQALGMPPLEAVTEEVPRPSLRAV